MDRDVTFAVAGDCWLRYSVARKRNPISERTEKSYRSSLNKLEPMIGSLPLAQITNKAVKEVVGKLADGLKPKTITETVNVIKYVVASVLDEEGEPVYPRKWNHDFIDLPTIGEQDQPAFTAKQISAIVSQAKGRYAVLYALLAGTGMRFGEALAIRLDPYSEDHTTISSDCRTIYVRKQVQGIKECQTKTKKAVRDVDVPSELTAFIKGHIGDRAEGWLFPSSSGKPLLQGNILRLSLHKILRGYKVLGKAGKSPDGSWKIKVLNTVPGVAPELTGKRAAAHAFRRFRETHLELEGLPQNLIDQQTGHKPKHISGVYFKPQALIEQRKQLIERAGLGFRLS
jgi:integrase